MRIHVLRLLLPDYREVHVAQPVDRMPAALAGWPHSRLRDDPAQYVPREAELSGECSER